MAKIDNYTSVKPGTNTTDFVAELKKFNFDLNKTKFKDDLDQNDGIGYEDLAALYDVSQVVNSTLILDDILNIVMTRAIKLFNTDRGFLMLLDDNGKLQFKTAHNIKLEQLDSEDMRISTTIADMVVKTGQSVYTSDARNDERFAQKKSIIDLNIRSAMCVPLEIKTKIIGVLYLDNSSRANIFLKQDLVLFEMFAAQAALAIHNARLYTELLDFQKTQDNLIKNTPIGILVVDADGIITEVNETSEKIFTRIGWMENCTSRNEIVGMRMFELAPRDYAGTFSDSIKRAKDKPFEISRLNIVCKGNEIILKLKFCPFENYEGISEGHIILIEDITEQVILEQYLILSEKLIAKGEMAAAIGHELNNYLTAISTNAQLLSINLAKNKLDSIDDKIDTILKNVDHIKRFSDGLMDFSALESKPVAYDLVRLVEDLIFFIHPQQAFKQVNFDIDIQLTLPLIYIDVGQIHQVFLNLFINAADEFARYRDGEGQITIKASYSSEENSVKVLIIDNGRGIREDILDKIFEPHVTSKKSGHGLGLWTCARIIENHEGKISVGNIEGGGAEFKIILPAASSNDE